MRTWSLVFAFCLLVLPLQGQSDTLDDIRLFQTFFQDAAVSNHPYGEGIFGFSDFDAASVINVGVRGAYPINPQFEIGGSLAFISADPDVGSGESGLSDLRITGRYHLHMDQPTQVTVGGFLTLPIGSEDVGQGETNFGAFGAVRHPLAPNTVLTGTISLEFLEGAPLRNGGWPGIVVANTDKETAILLGGGIIHKTSSQISLVGELNIVTEGDFAMLSGGVDYELRSGGRLRGTLGLGLDDGAPDLSLVFGFQHSFDRY